MNDLRLEFKARNNVLWHAIHAQHANVAQFCSRHGLNPSHVGPLLNLVAQPRRPEKKKNGDRNKDGGELKQLPRQLCDITGYSGEELFPPLLYLDSMTRSGVAEVSSAQFVGLSAARRFALPPAQDEELDGAKQHEVLEAVLATLTPREERVLRQRFGLDGDERTLEQVGDALGVGRERARQIEQKALRKLRHPSRADHLKPFLPETYKSVVP